MLTTRQKLILFLIDADPGIRDIYRMVELYDRADFPSNMTEHLDTLLNAAYIRISKWFDNGTPAAYEISEKGKSYLTQHFQATEAIEHVKQMRNPELLLKIVQTYIDLRTIR